MAALDPRTASSAALVPAAADDLAPLLRIFVAAARRRLWLERHAALMRRALPAGIAIALVLLLAHLLWRALPPLPVAVLALAPALLALGLAARRRPSASEATLWADRRFGGGDALPTCLEYLLDARRPASPDALAMLRRSGRSALAHVAPRLDATHVPGVPSLAALGVLLIAVIALAALLPGRPVSAGAAPSATTTVRGETARATAPDAPAATEQAAARELRAALQGAAAPPAPAPAASPAAGGETSAARRGSAPPRSARAGRTTDAAATGTVERNSSGREAGTNAAIADALASAGDPRARFDAVFRALQGGALAGTDGRASGEALALDPAAGLRDVASYDAAQRALAQRVPAAARGERPDPGPDGPAALAYARRYSESRGSNR